MILYLAGVVEGAVPETVSASGRVSVEPPPEATMDIDANPVLAVGDAVRRRVLG